MPEDFGLHLLEAARLSGTTVAEPREAQDRYVVANGLRLHYLDWGGDGKPWMLCLHGGSQNAHMWDFTALAFCDRYHIIALDQRGHGDSQWAPDGDYGIEAHQRDIAAFVDALGMDRFVLVGLSMGGRNAYTFAAGHPDRVRALAVVDVGPEIRRQGAERIGQFVTQDDELDSFEAFVQRTKQYNFRRPEWQIRGSLRHNLKQLPSGRWTWKYDRVLRDPARRARRPAVASPSSWEAWSSIRCPVLLARGGESDILAPEVAQRMQATLPGVRLVEVPGAGHLVPGDNPVGWEQALRAFLQDLGGRDL
ncbi:MAG: alpha/beta hydrolase [Chloroflexi bacterium]|nr:alpha/beta hydrolase [Chloroflexota bacterium]